MTGRPGLPHRRTVNCYAAQRGASVVFGVIESAIASRDVAQWDHAVAAGLDI